MGEGEVVKQVATTYHAGHVPLPLFDALSVHTAGVQLRVSAAVLGFAPPGLISGVAGLARPTAIGSL